MSINDWTIKHMPGFKEFYKQIAATADKRHGGPWDRGGADNYYGRKAEPHYFEGGSYTSRLVTIENMTEAQIDEYYAGYTENQQAGLKKQWD